MASTDVPMAGNFRHSEHCPQTMPISPSSGNGVWDLGTRTRLLLLKDLITTIRMAIWVKLQRGEDSQRWITRSLDLVLIFIIEVSLTITKTGSRSQNSSLRRWSHWTLQVGYESGFYLYSRNRSWGKWLRWVPRWMPSLKWSSSPSQQERCD